MDFTNILLVALSALVGGLLNSVLGWLKSNPPEPFNLRKFGASIVVNILGAAAFAVGYNYSGITNIWLACLGALVAGAGTVSMAKNTIGSLSMKIGKEG